MAKVQSAHRGMPPVVIPFDQYSALCECRDFLACLEAAGVENWEGYSLARIDYEGDSQDD